MNAYLSWSIFKENLFFFIGKHCSLVQLRVFAITLSFQFRWRNKKLGKKTQ